MVKKEKQFEEDNHFIIKCAQQSAEHYNILIWTVFSVGVALSLWILYNAWIHKVNTGPMWFFIPLFGLFVLFYCTLSIESFGQKKALMYKLFNQPTKLSRQIKELPFFRIDWFAEIILFAIFLAYIFFFWYVWSHNSLEKFGQRIISLDLPAFLISLTVLSIVLANWIKRPTGNHGNFIEKIRRFKPISYDEIIKK